MYNRNGFLDVARLFATLKLNHPSRLDQIIRGLGLVSGYLTVAIVVYLKLTNGNFDTDPLANLVAWGFMIYITCLAYIGVRYIGQSRGEITARSQVADVAYHLWWFGLFPALILTGLLWSYVLVFHPAP